MFTRLFQLLVSSAFLMLLSSCAEPVVFSEVFQQNADEKIYTAYNIWYTDPSDISCLNIQQGSFIPVGTEIEPVSTDRWFDRIVFKTIPAGKKFTINFDSGYRLCTMRDYIRDTFTTTPPSELLKSEPEAVRKYILRGEVVPGMSEKAVLLTYGPPPKCRTNDLRNESWIYWRSKTDTVRVIIRDDKVRSLINVGQEI